MIQSLFNSAKLFTAATYSQSFNCCEAKEEKGKGNEKASLTRKERKKAEAEQLDREQDEFIK